MSDEGLPDIYYVPGAVNHYKPDHDVIVLDEVLLEHPVAHEYIKQHEMQHSQPEYQSLLATMQMEFKTDLQYLFGTSTQIGAVREYYATRTGDSSSSGGRFMVVNPLRELWNVVLRPVAWVYRAGVRIFD